MRSDPAFARSRSTACGAVVALAVALAGCATGKDAPTSELATAKSAIDRVSATPTIATAAPVEMQSARDKLARAQRAMANENYDEARRLAEQAEADARVAESKVAANRSEQSLREIQASIAELNTRIDGSAGTATRTPVGTAPSPNAPVTTPVAPVAPPAPAMPMTPASPRR